MKGFCIDNKSVIQLSVGIILPQTYPTVVTAIQAW